MLKSELLSHLEEELTPRLSPHGFQFVKAQEAYTRTRDGVSNFFYLGITSMKGLFMLIDPSAGIRFDRVERIFHEVSGMKGRDAKESWTLWGSWRNTIRDPKIRGMFRVEGSSDISAAVKWVESDFLEFAIPMFEKFTTLEALDSLFNSTPSSDAGYAGNSDNKATRGIITAAILRRNDFDRLAAEHRRKLQTVDQGIHVKAFDALERHLRKYYMENVPRQGRR